MFFGPQRETHALEGHIEVHITDKSFAIIARNDYGGFTYEGDKLELPELNDSIYRQVHDFIISDRNRYPSSKEPEQTGLNYWPFSNHRISANIGFGDKVTNGEESFIVNGWHDTSYINKNQFYRLVDRPQFDPKPVTKEYFIEKLSKVNALKDWKVSTSQPKRFWHNYSINGNDITGYSGDNNFYIKVNDVIWDYKSNISAPYFDALEILLFKVYSEYDDGKLINYSIYEVNPTAEYDRWKVFDEPKSLHYNNALIGMTGKV